MAHMIKRMAFTGDTPWHWSKTGADGRSVRLTDPTNIETCMRESGLDWDVRLDTVYLADGSAVLEGKAVVREDTGRAIGLVGNGYRPLRNAEAFAWFKPWLDAGVATIETCGELKGGSRVWILAKMGPAIEVGDGDMVGRYALLSHAHNGSMAIRGGLTPIRVVCHNTLSAAIEGEGSGIVKIFHTAGAKTELSKLQAAIEAVGAQWDRVADTYRAMAATRIKDEKAVRAFVRAVYGAEEPAEGKKPGKREQAIVELFEAGTGQDLGSARGTAWGLYNALTEYVTHAAVSDAASKNREARQHSLAFGGGRRTIDRGMALIEDILQRGRSVVTIDELFGADSHVSQRVEAQLASVG